MNKVFFLLALIVVGISCHKNDFPTIGTNVTDHFWLESDGAKMKVVVEGNTASKTFLVIIHGGPGGDAQIYNLAATEFSDPLEEDYALVYWDQRGSGNSAGIYNQSTLTIEQYVTDLERLLTALEYQYGSDIGLFLLGHSWGGMLGTAFLTKPENEARIKGWINVDGVIDFAGYDEMVYDALSTEAALQIQQNNFVTEWAELQDFLNEIDRNNISDDEKLRLNNYGHRVDYWLRESGFVNNINANSSKYAYFSYHDSSTGVFNSIFTGGKLYNRIKDLDFTPELSKMQVPALFLWGKYDFVVPISIGQVAYDNHGGMDKELVIFERSGHSPMLNEAVNFNAPLIDFIERLK